MGSAASAPIKKQAKALKGRRYMRGMRPEKYFEVVVKEQHGELFEILGLSVEEAFEIFVKVMDNASCVYLFTGGTIISATCAIALRLDHRSDSAPLCTRRDVNAARDGLVKRYQTP